MTKKSILINAIKGNLQLYTILLFSLVVRLISINQSLWLDEATTGYLARDFSIKQILSEFSPGDFHPPFYYIFMEVWVRLVGYSETVLRLPSLVFGVITIYVVYLITKKLGWKKKYSLIATGLLSISGLHIYYSQEARMYALSGMLVSMIIYTFIKLLKAPRVVDFGAFSILIFINSFTDYLPNLILLVLFIYALLGKLNRKWWSGYLITHFPLIAGWFFWWPVFLQQLKYGMAVKEMFPAWSDILGGTEYKELLLLFVKFIIGRIDVNGNIGFLILISTIGLLYLYLLFVSFTKRIGYTNLLWMWFVVPIFVAFVIGFKVAVFNYFRFIFVIPSFYILVVHGINNLKPKNKAGLIIIILIITNLITSGLYLINKKLHREDWRSLVTDLNQHCEPTRCVVLMPGNTQTEAFRYYQLKADVVSSTSLKGKDIESVWLMRYVQTVFDPEDKTRLVLEENGYKKVKESDYRGVLVWKYVK